MSPLKNSATNTASYVLIIGSILSILPNVPGINEILPIYRFDSVLVKGGINFLESYLNQGVVQAYHDPITGWTILSIPGTILWIIFVVVGVLGILIGFIFKNRTFILTTGLIGGIIETILLVLVYLGDSRNFNKFGLSNFAFPNYQFIGMGFWILLIGSILILVSGLLVLKK